MAPKTKISRDELINAAVGIIREKGSGALNAREIAARLNCSTQPIFSNFATMSELEAAAAEAAYGIYLGFLESEERQGKYPPYKSFGMAYTRFAKEERELFKLLFMCDREGEAFTPTEDYTRSVEMIMKSGLTREAASRLHLEMWITVHGIATMLATSFLSLDEELISGVLTDVYQGLCSRHVYGGKK